MKSTAYALLMIILAASTVVSAKRPDMDVKVDSLEFNVQSLNDSIQSVLELMRTIQSTVDKQGTCMSDLLSSNCPDAAPRKIGLVDVIKSNRAGIISTKADINTNTNNIRRNINNIIGSIPAYNSDWTIIQRRGQFGQLRSIEQILDSEVNFDKVFSSYENGFGSVVDGELWIGLWKLASLTKHGKWELQVDLTDWDDKIYHAKYATFSVGPAPTYRLHVGGFKDGESTLEDSMQYHDGQAFSARDKDQDASRFGNCARIKEGGWWYKYCWNTNVRANLNGPNSHKQRDEDQKGIIWWHGKSRGNSYKTWKASVMKIKEATV